MSSRKPGRPSKGHRVQYKVRLPLMLKEAAAEAARAHGMTETDYVAALIAANTGLEHLAPSLNQEVLPLQKSA
ncbi:hypothetical protein ONR57_09000 [Hoyosella sp. YIM 151337]|uniref:hypothetical protein n=1 Tax=Hoyosella sp. YIM 151337 TaxID=2992742 RepID=UPI0022356991|nr:hypothetical protein [Hoyosella sp. YIM 151337]MCW4353432.1 hypothetical protein [Hoyosella sp. YIM 151337]